MVNRDPIFLGNYKQYQRLAEAEDNMGNYQWPEKVAKTFLGMTREAWKNIQGNSGFFTARGEPRQRAEKQVVSVRTPDWKFGQAKLFFLFVRADQCCFPSPSRCAGVQSYSGDTYDEQR